VREEIIRLSKQYGIVTPFTAGLITEDEGQLLPPRTTITMGIMHRSGTVNSPADAAGAFGGGFGGARGPAGPQGATGPAGAQGAPGVAGGLPMLATSGESAVAASKANRALKDDAKVHEDAKTRYVEGKSFFLRGDTWVDGSYDEVKSPKLMTIKFASPEYFALAKDKAMAKWLSVGERVIVVLNGKTVKIEP
jgi:Ca-activated chloride channel family protein